MLMFEKSFSLNVSAHHWMYQHTHWMYQHTIECISTPLNVSAHHWMYQHTIECISTPLNVSVLKTNRQTFEASKYLHVFLKIHAQ